MNFGIFPHPRWQECHQGFHSSCRIKFFESGIGWQKIKIIRQRKPLRKILCQRFGSTKTMGLKNYFHQALRIKHSTLTKSFDFSWVMCVVLNDATIGGLIKNGLSPLNSRKFEKSKPERSTPMICGCNCSGLVKFKKLAGAVDPQIELGCLIC